MARRCARLVRGFVASLAMCAALTLGGSMAPLGGGGTTAAGAPPPADLGTLGGSTSVAQAVSSTGQVVGYSTTASGATHAFSWTQGGGMVDLGTLGGGTSHARAVSDYGQVVGDSTTASGATHAFWWTQAGGMIDLGTLGGATSYAWAVSNHATVAGYSTLASGDTHAFLWLEHFGMQDLGTLGGSYSRAYALNDSFDVVGSATGAGSTAAEAFIGGKPLVALGAGPVSEALAVNGNKQVVGRGSRGAFSWTPADGLTWLTDDGGAALAVNPRGQVAGQHGDRMFWWTRSGGLVDLGTLGGRYSSPAGESGSGFRMLNASGEIVGSSTTSAGASHAFAWTPDAGMIDLGTLGGATSVAYAVNDDGLVVGSADTAAGQTHAATWATGLPREAYVLTDLGKIDSSVMGFTAMNHRGQAVGVNSALHAFSWTKDGGTIDLGTLGGARSYPIAVNDNGLVAGRADTSSGASHAFAWSREMGMVDLGPLDPSSRLASTTTDHVFGLGARPFEWTPAAGMVDLPGLPSSGLRVNAVNDHGQIVGSFTSETGDVHPFSWTAAGGFLDLGTGGYPNGAALLVSENGRVFGTVESSTGPRAFLWSREGGMTVYGVLPVSPLFMNNSGLVVLDGLITWTADGGWVRHGIGPFEPLAFSESGRVVGVRSDGHGGSYQAFAWTQAGGVVELGSLGNYGQSGAHSVTDDGTVYGWSEEAWPGHGLHVVRWSAQVVDWIPPTATPVASPAPNAAGWNRSDVTVTWQWADNGGSGLEPASCETSTTTSSEGVIVASASCRDRSGNTGDASYTVKVDKSPPQLAVSPVAADATSPAGATISYLASATDDLDAAPVVVCLSPSPSLFPAGDTTVGCTATDVAGNVASASFLVHVRGAAEQLQNLKAAVASAGIEPALARDLKATLSKAARQLGSPTLACRQLKKFGESLFGELGTSRSSVSTGDAPQLLGSLTVEQALGCLAEDSPLPAAARHTVALIAAVDELGVTRPWVRELRLLSAGIGTHVIDGELAAAAQALGAVDAAIRTDSDNGRLTTDQAAQLHAAVIQVGADLHL